MERPRWARGTSGSSPFIVASAFVLVLVLPLGGLHLGLSVGPPDPLPPQPAPVFGAALLEPISAGSSHPIQRVPLSPPSAMDHGSANSVSYTLDLATQLSTAGNTPSRPGATPRFAVAVPSFGELFVTCSGTHSLSVVSLSTLLPVDSIALPGDPGAPAYDNVSGELFIPLSNGNVTVVALGNLTLLTTFPVSPPSSAGQLYSAAYDWTHNVVFASDPALGQIDVIDAGSFNVTKRLGVGGGPLGLSLATPLHRLYVADFLGSALDVIDTNNATLLRSTPVGANPVQVAYDPRLGEVFVGAEGGAVAVVNASDGSPSGSVALNGSEALLYDPVDNRIWATLHGSPKLTLIDPANRSTTALLLRNGSSYLAIDLGSARVFALDPASDLISVLSAHDGREIRVLATGFFPYFMTHGTNDSMIWVVDQLNGWVVPVDAHRLTVGNPIVNVSLPGQVSSDPQRHEIYLSTGNGTVAFVNSSNGGILAQIRVGGGPAGSAYDAGRHRLYVADSGNKTVTVLDTLLRRVVGTLAVGAQPFSLALDAAGHRLFVGNVGSDNVTIVDTSTGRTTTSVAVAGGPRALAFDSADDRLFVASETMGAITVVNLSDPSHPVNLSGGVAIEGMAYDPISSILYAADEGRGSLLLINASSLSFLGSIPTGSGPTPVIYDPSTGSVWVGNFFGGSLSVLRTGDPTPLNSARLTARPASVELGNSTVITTIILGGDGRLAYSYSGLPTGCSSLDANALTCAPGHQGNFSVQVIVNDSVGQSAMAEVNVTASGTFSPSLAYFLLTPAALDVGTPLSVQVGVAEGEPPLSIAYAGLPSGCRSANAPFLNCTPSSPGSYSVGVVVSDARGRAVGSYRPLLVNARPSVSGILTAPASLEAGVPGAITVGISNGTGPFDVQWTGLPAGCSPANFTTLPCTPSTPGPANLSVRITDVFGETASGASQVRVLARLTISQFTASRTDVTIGRSTNLDVAASGGAGALRLTYSGLPPGCLSANQSRLTCRPVAIGIFAVGIQVADAQGVSAEDTLFLSVHPPPSILAFNITPNEVQRGGSVEVTVEATGGSGPLRFAYSGLPSGCSAENTTRWFCQPSEVGIFDLQVVVTDSEGVGWNASRMLQVDASPPAAATASAGTGVLSLELLALGGAVALIVTTLVLHRRRRPKG